MAETKQRKGIQDADLLFRHFCNCLYLGQWELAKACGQLLQDSDEGQSVHKILHDIAQQPFNRRYVNLK